MSDNVTDLYVTNLYLNNGTVNPLTLLQANSLGIHQMIGGSAWGWSPPIPGHTSVYFGMRFKSPNLFWQASTTPPTIMPPTFISPVGGENYGSINLTLPPGNFIVGFVLEKFDAGGIALFTLDDGVTTINLPPIDLYNVVAEHDSYPIMINNTNLGLTTYTINLQADTTNNVASAGFFIRYVYGTVDSINTTNAN